jgi:uncharacterized alpha-E superfamily protein
MCRYVERAENVARFLGVNLNLLLDMPSEAGRQWEPMIQVTGDHEEFQKRYGEYTQENVIQFLTFDRDYPNSIISCLYAARENARSIREIISSEMWEQLNTFYLDLKHSEQTSLAFRDPNKFLSIIKMRGHMFSGLMYSTMSHGEAWHFNRMGLLLERADKTSRILDVKYFMLLPRPEEVGAPFDNIQWAAVLKSASALEMYRKRFHRIAPKQVIEFLLFDEQFPRSIRHCLTKAEESMHWITGTPMGRFSTPAEKALGRLKADFDYTESDEVVAQGVHEFLDNLQTRLNKVDEAVNCTFFKLRPPQKEQTQSQ